MFIYTWLTLQICRTQEYEPLLVFKDGTDWGEKKKGKKKV